MEWLVGWVGIFVLAGALGLCMLVEEEHWSIKLVVIALALFLLYTYEENSKESSQQTTTMEVESQADIEQEKEQSCPAVETPQDKDDKIKDVLKQIESLEKDVLKQIESLEKEVASLTE